MDSFSILVIAVILYSISMFINLGMVFAYLQRTGHLNDAWLPARTVKDMTFAIVMSLTGPIGSVYIYLYALRNSDRGFTGIKFTVKENNRYWRAVAQKQERFREQYNQHNNNTSGHRMHGARSSVPPEWSRHVNFPGRSSSSGPIKFELATNDTGGRCKSIWED